MVLDKFGAMYLRLMWIWLRKSVTSLVFDCGQSIADRLTQLTYASDILFVITIYVAKLAIVLLFHRLAAWEAFQSVAKVIAISIVACCFVSVLVIAIRPKIVFAPWTVERYLVSLCVIKNYKSYADYPSLAAGLPSEA